MSYGSRTAKSRHYSLGASSAAQSIIRRAYANLCLSGNFTTEKSFVKTNRKAPLSVNHFEVVVPSLCPFLEDEENTFRLMCRFVVFISVSG